jgi:hypothetical protein
MAFAAETATDRTLARAGASCREQADDADSQKIC